MASPFHQPAFKAEPLIDTTGCGDVFHGAFLHGWLAMLAAGALRSLRQPFGRQKC
jgi:sugar/nucleoside kinase (ribokinase family)